MFKNLFLLSILFSLFILTSAKSDDLPYKEGELLVRFAPKTGGNQRTLSEQNTVLSSINGGTVKQSFKLVQGLTLVQLPANSTVQSSLNAFQNANGILYAEPNYKIKLRSTVPNDTRFGEQWGLHNTGQTWGTPGADIDAPKAWDIRTDASNVIVAVLDSGVDYEHPDLAGNMWVNETELYGDPNVDDDNNGYKDDIYGWDFYAHVNEPMDFSLSGHGTHCAGIIGAVANNNQGISGVCWNVQIMGLKIICGQVIETFISNAIEAIQYAVNNGANVINASWSIGGYSVPGNSLENAINAANTAGVLFIAAAGNEDDNNDTSNDYPSNYSCNNIISVMATNHADQKASCSNYGEDNVDLAAPGGETAIEYINDDDPEGILSTVLNDGYAFYPGTSMAAPYVAGACAEIVPLSVEIR